jgi:heme exporter protein C
MVMITQLLVSLINAVLYLKNSNEKNDLMAEQTARVGVLFGLLGLATGMVWAKATWGSFWHNDPKQIAAAIAILIYFAYFILRSSIEDPDKKARISNIYNIFCFPTFLMLIFIVPQVIPGSSHPVKLIVNKEMRVVYYPALLAWLFLSAWLVNLGLRVKKIEKQQHEAI